MNLQLQPCLEQRAAWPAGGRRILGEYDESTVAVYQAFRPPIGHYAAQHGHVGGGFRMRLSPPHGDSDGQ